MRKETRTLATTVGMIGAAVAGGCSGTDTNPFPADASAEANPADALDELFQDGSPEDIAQELEAMVDGPEQDGGPVPMYKGVTV